MALLTRDFTRLAPRCMPSTPVTIARPGEVPSCDRMPPHALRQIVRSIMGLLQRMWAALDPVWGAGTPVLLPYLTFVLLFVFSQGYAYHCVLIKILCVAGVLYRPLIRMPSFWLALATLLGMGVYLTWYAADNHKYLMAYWCLALACGLAVPEHRRRELLVVNARLLIGLCMALALGWKLLTPSFVDGSFFRLTLQSDRRFKYVASEFGGIPPAIWAQNRQMEKQLVTGYLQGENVETVQLADSPRLRALAAIMTWWTLAVESTLAVLFLWPRELPLVPRLRDYVLLVFVYSTYAIATVLPFGWTLIILGIAQTPPTSRWLRAAYFGAFLLVPLYLLPWQSALHALLFS